MPYRSRRKRLNYLRAYRKKNKKYFTEYNRLYFEKNREQLLPLNREYNRIHYKKNRKRLLARQKVRNKKRKEHIAAYSRDYYQKNKERKEALRRVRYKANPDLYRIIDHRRHARKRNARGKFTLNDIVRLYQKQQGKCAAPHCGIILKDKHTVDHKKPLARGGSNWPRNLQLLCHSCNSSKGDKTMKEWLGRLSYGQKQVPRAANVLE